MKHKNIIGIVLTLFLIIIITPNVNAIPINETVPFTLSNQGASSGTHGAMVLIKNNTLLVNVTIQPGSLATNFILMNSTGGYITSAPISGGLATISPNILLVSGQTYIFATNANGSSVTRYGANGVYPYMGTTLNWTSGYFNGVSQSGLYDIYVIGVNTALNNSPIEFVDPTPDNNTLNFYTNNSIRIRTNASIYPGNSTIRFYNSTFALLNTSTNTSNYTDLFVTNLSIGTYYYNATWTNGTISNYTATRVFTIYGLTSGNITSPISNSNITRFLNINWTNSTSTAGIQNYSIILLNSDMTLNKTLTTTTITNNSFYGYDMYLNNVSLGSYYLILKTRDLNNNYINSTPIQINQITDSQLNITVFSFNGTQISTFNTTINNNNYNTTTNIITVDILKNNIYNITTSNSGYSFNTTTYNSNSSIFQILNITLYPNNAVNITVRKESDGTIIYQNTSITLFSDSGLTVTGSLNGSGTFSGLTVDNYTISATTSGYTTRYARANIESGTYQTLTMYLNNGTQVLFNFKTNTGTAIPDVVLNVYRNVNGTDTLVEQRVSDVSGISQVSLETTGAYSFTTYAVGYNNYSFSLNPVLFTSYDVVLTATGGGNDVEPSAQVTFSPTSFFRFQNVNFNIQFVSQYDSLSNYYYQVTYPGGTVNNTGSNTHGESFNNQFNLGQAVPGSQVIIYYNYTLSNGVTYNQTSTYNIVYTSTNRTWVTLGNNINTTTGQDSTTGYYVGERIIIVTLISIVMFGVGWSIGGAIIGLVLALIPIIFFTQTQFVPKESYYVTIIFIIFYIISRGSDS